MCQSILSTILELFSFFTFSSNKKNQTPNYLKAWLDMMGIDYADAIHTHSAASVVLLSNVNSPVFSSRLKTDRWSVSW